MFANIYLRIDLFRGLSEQSTLFSAFTFAMSSSVRISSVCLSVTFVRPTRAIEIFGNVSRPFGTYLLPSSKILRRLSQGNLSVSVGGVKH